MKLHHHVSRPLLQLARKAGLLLALACTVSAPLTTHGQTTVFNDTFGGGSTVNSATPTPATPTINATAYQQISAKAFQAGTTATAGHLSYGLPATTSAVNMIEALFTQYPVTLVNTNDYIQFTATFTAQSIMMDYAASYLLIGLYNGSQVQPLPGGQITTAGVAGSAQGWRGYASRIQALTSSSGIYSRAAQTLATATSNQDVTYTNSSPAFTQVGSSQTTTIAAFTAASSYTLVYKITKTGASALTITSSLYSGTTATGTPLFTQTVVSSSIVTATFDALALGFRAAGVSGATRIQLMDVNAISVITNAATTIVPVISTQPFSQTKSVGDPVTLSVVANGGGSPSAALSYQWKKDTVDIPSANSASYAIPSASLSDAGNYTVYITNSAGNITSDTAILSVTSGSVAPSFLTHPASATILSGATTTFTTLTSGTATITYQWQFSSDAGANYTDIPTATSSSYQITNAPLSAAGLYRLVATNAQGSATSNAATLTVNQAPAITLQPVGASLNPGDSISLSVTATGSPAPTYQWKLNGVAISGATSSTFSATNITGANAGNYTVVVTNSVSTATSNTASIVVLSPSLAVTAVTPVNSGTNLLPDTRLTLTFNAPVTAGVSGLIRIYDASNDSVVDTIDLVAATTLRDTLRASSTLSTLLLPVQNKSIGGTTNFNYYPITISGNTATLYPRNGVLSYAKSYYVKIDAGSFTDATGLGFAGINNNTTWAFTTKAAGPTAGTTSLTVAADGSGDFVTVQAALDFVPTNNTTPTTIYVKNGTYFEEIVFTNKGYITLLGQDRNLTTIVYPNNNTFNNVGGGIYHRSTVIGSGISNCTFANLKFLNSTPQNGSQAEVLIISGNATTGKNIVTNCSLYSYQDTVQFGGQVYISDSYIEGDVDFLWGAGPCFFENCDIKILRTGGYFTQIRNGNTNHGYVFHNTRFLAASGITGTFFGRINPTSGNSPYSEVVILDSTFGDATNNAFLNTTTGNSSSDYKASWWLLNGVSASTVATAAATAHNWTYNIVDKDGVALTDGNSDTFTEMPTDATTLANYRSAFWVLNHRPSDNTTPGTWTPALSPVILTQPSGASINSGQAASFSVSVAAIPSATYVWKLNGNPISGATSSTYNIASAIVLDAGSYTVTVTNANGNVTSSPAVLTVTTVEPPPAITTQPTSQSGTFGTTASFTCAASGNGVTFQWYKNSFLIGGATSPSLSLSNLGLSDANTYYAIATNTAGTAQTNTVTLTVTDPYAAFLAAKGIASPLSAPASGDYDNDSVSNLLEYFLNGDPANPAVAPAPVITMTSGPTLVFEYTRRKDAAAFITNYVEWSTDLLAWTTAINGTDGVVATVSSLDATTEHVVYQIPVSGSRAFARLRTSVALDPVINSQPLSLSIATGAAANFTVTAGGLSPYAYQWYKDGVAIPAATSASFAITSAVPLDAANYTVVVSNWAGSVTSAIATLNVASNLPVASSFTLEGFATLSSGTSGGGPVNFASPDANYIVIDSSTPTPASTLKSYLESTSAYVIELRTDIDLAVLNNVSTKPKFPAWLGVTSMGMIQPRSNKTLFSVTGATLRHGIIEISSQSNIMIRNLKFRGLWEWDDASDNLASPSPGGYKVQDWDYVRVQGNAFNIWIDHCDLEKSYDGIIDIKQGASLVTVSWCRLSGDNEGVASSMIDYLEALYLANPADPTINYYALKRSTRTKTQVLALEIPQDKCNLLGAGDPASMSEPAYSADAQTLTDGGRLNITFHHNWYRGIRQRQPRLRYGNGHVYNNYLDETSLVGTGVSSVGLAVTTNAVMLSENNYFAEVGTPLSVNTTTFPARALAQTGCVWIKNSIDVSSTLNSQTGVTARAALVWNSPRATDPLAATWTTLTALPYSYTLDAADYLKNNTAITGAIVPTNELERAILRTYLVNTSS